MQMQYFLRVLIVQPLGPSTTNFSELRFHVIRETLLRSDPLGPGPPEGRARIEEYHAELTPTGVRKGREQLDRGKARRPRQMPSAASRAA